MKLTIAIPQSRGMIALVITTVAATIAATIAPRLRLIMFANRDPHSDFIGHSKAQPVPVPILTTPTTSP
jgi:hypothetical protein